MASASTCSNDELLNGLVLGTHWAQLGHEQVLHVSSALPDMTIVFFSVVILEARRQERTGRAFKLSLNLHRKKSQKTAKLKGLEQHKQTTNSKIQVDEGKP